MTSETGNRRHPTGKGSDSFPVPPPKVTHLSPGEIAATTGFISHPILDPVRGAALTAAIAAYRYGFDWPDTDETPPPPDNIITEILTMAERFELYLTGEEADGEAD